MGGNTCTRGETFLFLFPHDSQPHFCAKFPSYTLSWVRQVVLNFHIASPRIIVDSGAEFGPHVLQCLFWRLRPGDTLQSGLDESLRPAAGILVLGDNGHCIRYDALALGIALCELLVPSKLDHPLKDVSGGHQSLCSHDILVELVIFENQQLLLQNLLLQFLLLQFHQLLECHQVPVRLWNLIDSLKERVTWGLTTASCPHWTRCVWQAKTRRAPQHQNNDKANAGQSIERQHHCWSCYEFQWLRADKGHQYFSQKAVTNIACPRLRDLLTLSRLLLRKASHVWRFVCNTCSLKLGLPTRRWTRMIIFSTERTKDTSIPSSNPKHKHKTQQPQQLSPSSKPNIDTSL